MGTTFTALLLRKHRTNYQYTLRNLEKCLETEGYLTVQDPKEADVTFSQYLFGEQGWQMITGDDMVLLCRLAERMAEKNKAETLLVCCCDSDFVEFELFQPEIGTSTSARAGRSYDESDPPQVEQEKWQAAGLWKKEIDYAEIFEKERVFAEEALVDLGDALGFDGSVVIESACGAGKEPDKVFYVAKKDMPPKRITEGMPCLERRSYYDKPVPVDEPYQWSFINRGGPSMGVELMIYGPFVEKDRMTFTDVYLQAACDSEEDGNERLRYDPAKPIQKIRLTNGWYAYRYRFPNLPLPPGLNFDYMRIQPDYALAAALSIDVSVTAKGDARCGLDVYFSIVPMNCPDRNMGFAWTVCGVENHKQWIAEHNSWYEQHGEQKEFLLDPKDFEYET